MITYNRKELPTEIVRKGNEYRLDIEATSLFNKTNSNGLLKLEMANNGKLYVRVNVLPERLRKRTDLTQRPFNPSVWIFTCKSSLKDI